MLVARIIQRVGVRARICISYDSSGSVGAGVTSMLRRGFDRYPRLRGWELIFVIAVAALIAATRVSRVSCAQRGLNVGLNRGAEFVQALSV